VVSGGVADASESDAAEVAKLRSSALEDFDSLCGRGVCEEEQSQEDETESVKVGLSHLENLDVDHNFKLNNGHRIVNGTDTTQC